LGVLGVPGWVAVALGVLGVPGWVAVGVSADPFSVIVCGLEVDGVDGVCMSGRGVSCFSMASACCLGDIGGGEEI